MNALAWILAENVLALAYSESGEVDEYFAVQQLERIAVSLRDAEEPVRRAFIETVREMVKEARISGEEQRSERLAEIPARLGLRLKGRSAAAAR